MFYAHANPSGAGFDLWWLLNLRAFQAGLIHYSNQNCRIPSGVKTNPDRTSFKWFDIRSPSRKPIARLKMRSLTSLMPPPL